MPIITGEEGICKGCGVATLSINYYDLGYQTGLMAYDILVNGEDVSKMEVQFAPNVVKKYDADRCNTLGILPSFGFYKFTHAIRGHQLGAKDLLTPTS